MTKQTSTNNLCLKCGKPYIDDNESTVPKDICDCNIPMGLQGWVYPNCGSGLSPYTTICLCNTKYDTTCTKADIISVPILDKL